MKFDNTHEFVAQVLKDNKVEAPQYKETNGDFLVFTSKNHDTIKVLMFGKTNMKAYFYNKTGGRTAAEHYTTKHELL